MPKRGENIRKRKDGRWEARILNENGKYKSIYAESYCKVKQKLKNINVINIKSTPIMQSLSFEDLCNKWIIENETKNKQSTTAKYNGIIQKHIIPFFNKIKTSELELNDVNTFIRQKIFQENLNPNTVNNIITVLIQIIKYGENHGVIDYFNYDVIKPAANFKELEILTEDEQKRLVSSIKSNITDENIGILLSLYTGLRIGEICALTWEDIDITAGTIYIRKTLQRISMPNKATGSKTTVIVDTPKSHKSIRKIPIPDFLLAELKKLSGNCTEKSYILTSSEVRYTEPRAYQYKFKKYLNQAGIRNINFHALRHTFATRAIEQNVDIKSLSEILGHSTVSFTLDKYVHPSFSIKKQSLQKLAVYY